jgi:hypothetical protein
MAHSSGTVNDGGAPRPESRPGAPGEPVVIDCDDCAVRGLGCRDCVVSVLLGVPESLLYDEQVALEALAEVGLAPRLRLVPIRRDGVMSPKGVA